MSNQKNKCIKLQIDYQKLAQTKQEYNVLFAEIKKEKVTTGNINQIKPKIKAANIKKQELKDKLKQIKERLIPEIVRELMDTETKKLSEFFGEKIKVPVLPKEITKDRIEKWNKQGFELHYLPTKEMALHMKYKNWQKPTDLNTYIQEGLVDWSVFYLTSGWILIDGRDKPDYDDGKQMYKDDVLGEAINELREKNVIKDYKIKDSRYCISWDELNKDETKREFAVILGVKPEQIDLPKVIEWNVIGNIHHNQWGDTDTGEWFKDKFKNDRNHCLVGGGVEKDQGGFSVVGSNGTMGYTGGCAFRLLIRFPEDEK